MNNVISWIILIGSILCGLYVWWMDNVYSAYYRGM